MVEACALAVSLTKSPFLKGPYVPSHVDDVVETVRTPDSVVYVIV